MNFGSGHKDANREVHLEIYTTHNHQIVTLERGDQSIVITCLREPDAKVTGQSGRRGAVQVPDTLRAKACTSTMSSLPAMPSSTSTASPLGIGAR